MSHDTAKSNKDFISYDLAAWAANLTYDKLSSDAIASAKLFLYDSLGCALGGSKQHDVEITLGSSTQKKMWTEIDLRLQLFTKQMRMFFDTSMENNHNLRNLVCFFEPI